jgi:hypothetical protein
MTADFVAATSAQANTAANSVAVPWASTTANDICLLALVLGGLSTITDPSGWTAVDTLDESTTLRTKLWWYRCTGSESGSLTVGWTGTAQLATVGMVAYRGIYSGGSPIEAHSVTGSPSTSTSHTNLATPTITNTCLQVCVFCDVQTTAAQSWTPPATFVERLDTSTTATPFLGLEFTDAAALSGSTTSAGLAARTATSAQSSAYTAFDLGLRINVTALTDPASGGSYVSPFSPVTVITELFQGTQTSLTTGQIWPRGKK